MKLQIELRNLDQVLRRVERLGAQAAEANALAIGWAGEEVRGAAKQLAPVDTGELGRNITANSTRQGEVTTAEVISGAAHSIYVEFGTGQRGDPSVAHRADWAGVPARPYMRRALQQNTQRLRDAYAKRLRLAVRKLTMGGG